MNEEYKNAIIEDGRVLCPYCYKLNLKVDGSEVIRNLKIKCRGSRRNANHCFVVNFGKELTEND